MVQGLVFGRSRSKSASSSPGWGGGGVGDGKGGWLTGRSARAAIVANAAGGRREGAGGGNSNYASGSSLHGSSYHSRFNVFDIRVHTCECFGLGVRAFRNLSQLVLVCVASGGRGRGRLFSGRPHVLSFCWTRVRYGTAVLSSRS